MDIYNELVLTKNQYLQRSKIQPENGFSKELIHLVWKQFGLIHAIIQDLADISNGVIDVVTHSKAKYLEIRSTPKSMNNQSTLDYIKAFEEGLILANQVNPNKEALGLLSLDRTIHSLKEAQEFIQYILKSPHNVLAGLDICGNPLGKRTLTGHVLQEVITLALNKGLSIAIHLGEADTEDETNDIDIVLTTLEQWKSSQISNKNPLYGKVRLGHCIYLSDQQKQRIIDLAAPIEVCPTCHSLLNWHLEKKPHPVKSVYGDVSQPLVTGTDNESIFNGSAKDEFNKYLSFFANEKQLSRKEIKQNQAQFYFKPFQYHE